MNIGINAMPENLASPAVAPVESSATRLFYWSLRRELWENRAIYLGPLAAAALFLLGYLINMINLRRRLQGGGMLDPAQQHAVLAAPYEMAGALIMGTGFIVGIFYSLDALYGERRDRSILFWKSLPVSDLTSVLSKVTIPLVVLPLLSFAITVVTQAIMLLASRVVLLGTGLNLAILWTQSSFLRFTLLLLYHIVTVHGLWYAPFYGWLLLVSAWAPRAPFIWAFLPPFAISGFEKLAFNTSHFLTMLKDRLAGPENPAAPGSTLMQVMAALTPGQFFSLPGLWIGLAIAGICLAAAVRLRKSRGPI
jgi:ABC-2 type transport system permease protein